MNYISYKVEAYSLYRLSEDWKSEFRQAMLTYRPKISIEAWKAHKLGLRFALEDKCSHSDNG